MADSRAASELTVKMASEATAETKIAFIEKHLDEIEIILRGSTTRQEYVAQLNAAGFDISFDLFKKYLHLCRQRAQPNSPNKRTRRTAQGKLNTRSPSRSPSPATPAKSASTRSNTSDNTEIFNPSRQEPEDDWNDTEHLIGYRLEDCIRPYVSVVNGQIIRNFPKGTILRLEIRNAMARLDNIVHPS